MMHDKNYKVDGSLRERLADGSTISDIMKTREVGKIPTEVAKQYGAMKNLHGHSSFLRLVDRKASFCQLFVKYQGKTGVRFTPQNRKEQAISGLFDSGKKNVGNSYSLLRGFICRKVDQQ